MRAVLYRPAVGHVPALENTPASFHQPIHDLAALGSVETMITSISATAVTVLLAFKGTAPADYRPALNCFRGYRPTRLEIDSKNHILELSLRA